MSAGDLSLSRLFIAHDAEGQHIISWDRDAGSCNYSVDDLHSLLALKRWVRQQHEKQREVEVKFTPPTSPWCLGMQSLLGTMGQVSDNDLRLAFDNVSISTRVRRAQQVAEFWMTAPTDPRTPPPAGPAESAPDEMVRSASVEHARQD